MGIENAAVGTGAELKTEVAPPRSAEDPWAAVYGLPCELSVAMSVAGFKVRDLLELDSDSIVGSQSSAAGPVGVWVNGVEIAKAEFDVLGTRLAIRIGELD